VYGATLSPRHTRATCWANRLAWQLAQLCIFAAHVGKTTQQQHKWQNHLHFPPFWSKSHEETMVCHWLIDSNSSALSSQHPQTLRFFPREAKNIKHDRYFLQGLERSNPHENYPHTRATCWANRSASFSRVRRNRWENCRHWPNLSRTYAFFLPAKIVKTTKTQISLLCFSYCNRVKVKES
jgi:hypothetical protein